MRALRAAAWTAAALALLCAGATDGWAQTTQPAKPPANPNRERKWSLDVHGGMSLGATPSGGSAVTLPSGAAFSTFGGKPSRSIPSWFFGDGALLFNQVQAQYASVHNVQFAQIEALDSTLKSSFGHYQPGLSVGGRLARKLTRRVSLEFGFDWSQRSIKLSRGSSAGLEATRASFENAFNGLLATMPSSTATVTATLETTRQKGSQISVAGGMTIVLTQRGRMSTFVTGGVGVLINTRGTLETELHGEYQFSIFDTFPIGEIDSLKVRVADRAKALFGLASGGLMYDLSPRRALRFEARVMLSGNGLRTSIDATPGRRILGQTAFIDSTTSPSIQFSSASGIKASLGAPPISDLTTFAGSGLMMRVGLTAGYVIRF